MGQYTPMYKAKFCDDINSPLKPLEYKVVEQAMVNLGLTEGYAQLLSSASDCYTPAFDGEGV